MGATRALLLAGAMALGVVNVAHAADMPLPPPPAPVYVPEPVVFSGWYIRGDAGAGLTDADVNSEFYDKTTGLRVTPDAAGIGGFGRDRTSFSDVGYVDLGVGYEFNNWFRADITGEVRSEAKYSTSEHYSFDYLIPAGAVPGQLGHDNYHGSVQSSVFMVNGYVTLGTWYGLSPYLQGGVGAAYHQMGSLTDYNPGTVVNYTDGSTTIEGLGGGGFANPKNKWNLAWAGGAGFSYDLTSNLKLDIGYRYLDMGDIASNNIVCVSSCSAYERHKLHLASNDVHIGLRWLINDYVAPPPPPELPIIRKY